MADIHANLEALKAVLADAKDQGCNQYAFLGDFVGYCADPKACLEIVRAMDAPCVKGNHDEYCTTDLPLDYCNPRAAKVVQWTRKQLSEADRQWLRNLPYSRSVEGFTIVHSGLDRPERWSYIFDNLAATASMAQQKTAICFYGHTHIPVVFIRDTVVRGGTYSKLKLEAGKQYLINPGAVGQPRDNNPKAAYVVYDVGSRTIEVRRLTYDIAAAQRKIRDAGLDTR